MIAIIFVRNFPCARINKWMPLKLKDTLICGGKLIVTEHLQGVCMLTNTSRIASLKFLTSCVTLWLCNANILRFIIALSLFLTPGQKVLLACACIYSINILFTLYTLYAVVWLSVSIFIECLSIWFNLSALFYMRGKVIERTL